jgi:exonuclease VII small subunit
LERLQVALEQSAVSLARAQALCEKASCALAEEEGKIRHALKQIHGALKDAGQNGMVVGN